MKHRIVFLCSAILFLALGAVAQEPTMVFDGSKLSITVPSGRLEFQRDEIGNDAIRNCFEWGGRESCMFMANSEPYEFRPTGLSTDEQVSIPGIFNGDTIILNVEMRPVPQVIPVVEEPNKLSTVLMYVIPAAIIVAVLTVVLILRRKKKREANQQAPYDPSVISIIKDESVNYERGLTHVMEHPNEYITVDMNTVFADTAVNKVYLHTTLVKKLYEFFCNSLEADGRTNETGCFIVGCWDLAVEKRRQRYDISLEFMVEPGDDADFGEYSLNFGKKISINMASVIDNLAQKTNRDYLLTCWMHSHPGLGLFLSNQDLIVQKQLTYSDHRDRLLAIVIDTNTPELKTGFFTAKADGTMNNREEVKRWFSFEEIFRECREKNRNNLPKQETEEGEKFGTNPDCFNVTVNGDTMDYIGFAPHAINQIDTSLFAGTQGGVGYFFGEDRDRYMEVTCALPYDNEDKVGCLIYEDGLDSTKLYKYTSELKNVKFFVNCASNDKMYIWVKNASGTFEIVGESTLTQMKEWIRRKRV